MAADNSGKGLPEAQNSYQGSCHKLVITGNA
jgi:hypothetical protein